MKTVLSSNAVLFTNLAEMIIGLHIPEVRRYAIDVPHNALAEKMRDTVAQVFKAPELTVFQQAAPAGV